MVSFTKPSVTSKVSDLKTLTVCRLYAFRHSVIFCSRNVTVKNNTYTSALFVNFYAYAIQFKALHSNYLFLLSLSRLLLVFELWIFWAAVPLPFFNYLKRNELMRLVPLTPLSIRQQTTRNTFFLAEDILTCCSRVITAAWSDESNMGQWTMYIYTGRNMIARYPAPCQEILSAHVQGLIQRKTN